MALIGARDLSISFGHPPLLDGVTFQVAPGERVCLVGRNGSGKSTLLKLLAGNILPDGGEVWRQQGITTAVLDQEVPASENGTVFDVVAGGMGKHLQSQQVEATLSLAKLDADTPFAELSSGMKRRVLFARAVVASPDVLLLDEPTNHLDIASITWLESFLLRQVKTLLFVTHDRAFLRRIATRIVELDRGRVFSYDCDYDTYLTRRAAQLDAEAAQNRRFDKKLSQEEVWIRQGIKARRTRNEGRVRALEKLREAGRARRKQTGNVKLAFHEAERSGKLVIEADSICVAYENTPLIHDFSTLIMRGDKVGIMGPNGVGKTTLLDVLLKNRAPDAGQIRHGTKLQVAYFDQLRAQLDEEKTVKDNIADGNDFLDLGGSRRHIIGYLGDFLFPPDRCRTPVKVLSGGERNRLLLAKLFTRPANVIVMDEPTNDLDTETLELLEERLFEFSGTLLLVSHDRSFLNNVVTSTIVFEGNGVLTEYAGGYDDWCTQRSQSEEVCAGKEKQKDAPPPRQKKQQKLGYMEQRELDALPKQIETLEAEQQALHDKIAAPAFYRQDHDTITRVTNRLAEVEQAVEAAYNRWDLLEDKLASFR